MDQGKTINGPDTTLNSPISREGELEKNNIVVVTPQPKKKENINACSTVEVLASDGILQKTPTDKIPITPNGEVMHPHHHHATTTNPLDEARWLGFWRKGLRTEPVKKSISFFTTENTPTKVGEPLPSSINPDFEFKFKRQSIELSPEAQKIMVESKEEATKIRSQIVQDKGTFLPKKLFTDRKFAKPKAKVGRFSDAHMLEFKKMDSIANHPSSFRTDPKRVPHTTLKRSRSKADLDRPEQPALSMATASAVMHHIIPASTPAKRIKGSGSECFTAKTATMDNSPAPSSSPSAKRYNTERIKSYIGRPKGTARLSTPMRNGRLPRSNSVKPIRMSMAPSFIHSEPRTSLFPAPLSIATKSPETPKVNQKPVLSLKSPSVNSPAVKSILRRPQILYSDDPRKIAAGTHLAFPGGTLDPNLRQNIAPATAPVRKHVDFTKSIKEKAERDEKKGANWSIFKEAEMGEAKHVPDMEQVNYPAPITYPTLRSPDEPHKSSSPTCRKDPKVTSGDFTFRAGSPLKFDTSRDSNNRPIRETMDSVHPTVHPEPISAKRKMEDVDESDKENNDQTDIDKRPAKRTKSSGISTMHSAQKSSQKLNAEKKPTPLLKNRSKPKKSTPSHRLAQRNETQIGGLSRERLNYLAMPKRR